MNGHHITSEEHSARFDVDTLEIEFWFTA